MSKFGFCSRFGGFLAKRVGDVGYTIYRGRCKQWACPECSQYLRSKWRAHLAQRIQDLGGKWCFITITAPSYGHTDFSYQLKKSSELFKKEMNNVMIWIRRNYGSHAYVRVLEIQKRGAIHAHILMNFWFPLPLWRVVQSGSNKGKVRIEPLIDYVVSRGFGHSCIIEHLEGSPLQASVYITKYITKESRELGEWLPKGTRYIQTSQSIGALNERVKSSDEWTKLDSWTVGSLVRRGKLVWDGDKKDSLISFFELNDNMEYEV